MTAQQTAWAEYRENLWNQMEARMGYPGLAHMEQLVWRSSREKVCAECGGPGEREQPSTLIKSVKRYYLCGECDDYYRAKHA